MAKNTGPTFLLSGRQGSRQLAKRLRTRYQTTDGRCRTAAGLSDEGGNRVRDKIHIDDVDSVVGTKRQDGQSGKEHECLHHIELSRFGVTAVAQHDARPEDRLRGIGQQARVMCSQNFLVRA